MSAQAWVALVVGVLGFAGVLVSLAQANRTLRQRANADDRAEAWKRITWCLEQLVGTNRKAAVVAMRTLAVVAESPFITDSERDVLIVTTDLLSDEVAQETGTGDTEDEQEVQS